MPHTDQVLQRINLALLLVVSFLPSAPTLIAENLEAREGAERVAVVFCGLVLLTISLPLAALWRYARAEGLVDTGIDEERVQAMSAAVTPSLGSYAVAILLGLVLPKLAVVAMLVAAVLLAVPPEAIRHMRRARP